MYISLEYNGIICNNSLLTLYIGTTYHESPVPVSSLNSGHNAHRHSINLEVDGPISTAETHDTNLPFTFDKISASPDDFELPANKGLSLPLQKQNTHITNMQTQSYFNQFLEFIDPPDLPPDHLSKIHLAFHSVTCGLGGYISFVKLIDPPVLGRWESLFGGISYTVVYFIVLARCFYPGNMKCVVRRTTAYALWCVGLYVVMEPRTFAQT